MSQALSPQDEIERTSVAFKNGFKHPKVYKGSWRKFESNEDLGAVWIKVDSRGVRHVGVDNQQVASRLVGKKSTVSGRDCIDFSAIPLKSAISLWIMSTRYPKQFEPTLRPVMNKKYMTFLTRLKSSD